MRVRWAGVVVAVAVASALAACADAGEVENDRGLTDDGATVEQGAGGDAGVPSDEGAEGQAIEAPGSGDYEADGDCPAPGEGRALLRDDEGGYCFLYPDEFTSEAPVPGIRLVRIDSGQPPAPGDPMGVVLSIETLASSGLSAADLADQRLSGLDSEDIRIERSTATLAGIEAVVADGVPGLAPVRQAYVVRSAADLAHVFTIMPMGEGFGDLSEQAEALWAVFLETIRFIEPDGASGG